MTTVLLCEGFLDLTGLVVVEVLLCVGLSNLSEAWN